MIGPATLVLSIILEAMVVNSEREKVWQERVAQWRASGLSQRAYAIEQGFPIRQVGYWVRRLPGAQAVPALLPVRVAAGRCGSGARSTCAASTAGR